MSISKAICDEIDRLIGTGEELEQKASASPHNLGEEVGVSLSWVTRTGELIKRLYPPDSQHLVTYQECIRQNDFTCLHSRNYRHISMVNGLLKGIKHEIEHDLLDDLTHLVQADIFSDFLEMGEHLLDEGYKDASAVIIGSVLEDSLRKLADANSVPIAKAGRPLTIDPINSGLAKANVYNKLIQKQITSWADLRNNAAHGHYDEYTKDQVVMMLLFTQQFCADHLK